MNIVEEIGLPACLESLAEECSELSQAALKLSRKLRDENPTPCTWDSCIDSLKEEIQDVLNVLHVIPEEYCPAWEPDNAKMKRWEQRIREHIPESGRRDQV